MKKATGIILGSLSIGFLISSFLGTMLTIGLGSVNHFSIYHVLLIVYTVGAITLFIQMILLGKALPENVTSRFGQLIITLATLAIIFIAIATYVKISYEKMQQGFRDERLTYVQSNCTTITKSDFSYKKCPRGSVDDEVNDIDREKYNAYINEYELLLKNINFTLGQLSVCSSSKEVTYSKPVIGNNLCSFETGQGRTTTTSKWASLPEGWSYDKLVQENGSSSFKLYIQKTDGTFVVCNETSCGLDTDQFFDRNLR